MKKYYFIAAALVLLAGAATVYANPIYFAKTTETATATTSLTSLYTASPSTSLTYDSYTSPTSPTGTDYATLLVRHLASTTASVVTVKYTYSQDGIDWYDDFVSRDINATGATSSIGFNTYTITGNTTSSTTLVALKLPTPTRYVRVTLTATTATSSVWAQIVPAKERTQ